MSNKSSSVPAPPTPAANADALQEFRVDLLAVLPHLLRTAIRGYRTFAFEPPPPDAKGFVAHQAACRAALAHMHLLIGLARWAAPAGEGHSPVVGDEDLRDLIAQAEAALGDIPPNE